MNRISKEKQYNKRNLEVIAKEKISLFGDVIFENITHHDEDIFGEILTTSRTFLKDILLFKQDIKIIIDKFFNTSYFNVDEYNHNSDGYKSMYNIISYIVYMSVIESKNKDLTTLTKYCKQIKGVVLIDEIDSYIHQQVQFKIIKFLDMLFPKISFIFSTHSPLILKVFKKTEPRYMIYEGELLDRTSVFFENLDIIVKDEFHVTYYENMPK